MDVKDALLKNLGITKLTPASLKEAIANRYNNLPDSEKRRINREIAHHAMKLSGMKPGVSIRPGEIPPRPSPSWKDGVLGGGMKAAGTARWRKEYKDSGKIGTLPGINVLGINYAGPLDVTIEWKAGPDGTLEMAGCRTDSGGDQINISKVFGSFDNGIALIARTGRAGGQITREWERGFLNKKIKAVFIRDAGEDELAALYNIIDGDTLPGMFGWADELSRKTVENINNAAMAMLSRMVKSGSGNIWMALSAGGPLRYNAKLAYYASLINLVKKRYRDRIKLLIDFKFMSGMEEAMSVLDIRRPAPQDIIKPNVEEFIKILVSSGLAAERCALDKDTITEEAVKSYAIKLRGAYNLLGVLVSMDKAGLVLVMKDRIIREKGIEIHEVCPTGAGDSLKAGFLYALSNGSSFEEAVHAGNLFGAGTASMEGTQTVTPRKLAEVEALAREQNVTPEVEYLKTG